MELLSARPSGGGGRAVWLALLAASALAIVLASCFAFPGGVGAPTFPHNVHIEGMKLQCAFCHVTVRSADLPSMPPPELCAPCHDELDRGVPPERRIEAFYDPGGRYRRTAPAKLPADVVYSHRVHAGQAKLDCAQCHAAVIVDDRIRRTQPEWKTRCMECHAGNGMDNHDCSKCHRQIDRDWKPANHFFGWDKHHGDVVRSRDRSSVNRCSLCHEQSTSCQACHENNPPANHNNFFRLRGHGILASMDRSRCATCHKSDTCEQCHRETRPISHRGGFGEPAERHCTGCHFPLGDTGCVVCHRSTPSHQLATPLPPTHSPAMNCRLCHGNGQPLPHPDGGHACTICHK